MNEWKIIAIQAGGIFAIIFVIMMGVHMYSTIAEDLIHMEPIDNKSYHSHTGEIIDVHFVPNSFMSENVEMTIVQFRDGKVLEIYGIVTEIHVSSNTTITYFKSDHSNCMIFTTITYEHN